MVDLQIRTHHLQEQHEAEIFELKSEVGTEVCPCVPASGHWGEGAYLGPALGGV